MVNGSKTFISGVREATKYGGGYVTVVKTSPELAHKGLSLCYLPVKDIPGITTNVFKQMGERRNIYRRHNHKKCGDTVTLSYR